MDDCCEISCMKSRCVTGSFCLTCEYYLQKFGMIGLAMLFHSIVSLIVLSSVAYHYFNTEENQYFFDVNMRVLFGCGVGEGFLAFCAIWFFVYHPRSYFHYVLIFPGVLVLLVIYIVYTRDVCVDHCIEAFDKLWPTVTLFSKFQVVNECCGWWNATDRGLTNCPLWYQSGCAFLVREYIEVRFSEIRTWTLFIMVLFIVSVSWLAFLAFVDPNRRDLFCILDRT